LLQSWVQVGTICVVLVSALFYQTHYMDKRFEDIGKRFEDIGKRFEDMDKRLGDMGKCLGDINHRFDDLKDWIRSEVRRLEDRLDRLEHPVAKS
jgi:DNA anti-recombination protein RmuC